MSFTTLTYCAFFALVFLVYYIIPKKCQWMVLLCASWLFYSYVSAYYLIFLAVTTLVTYVGAVMMDDNIRRQCEWISKFGKSKGVDKCSYKNRMAARRRFILIGVIVVLLSMLGVFKYLEFILQNVAWIGSLIGLHIKSPGLNLILPIGLSFYIFQSMGYCIDVQREIVPAERNLFRHALFVSFFPQLLQGPIGDYSRLSSQLFESHEFDYVRVKFGLQRVAYGVFKKLVIANTIAHKIDVVWTSVNEYSGIGAWSVILFAYAIQLYADFSGYMDIACGCAKMLGIKLDENFNCPYFAKDIADFWRRWHMTLSEWFKNYLFYPSLRSDWASNLRKRFKNKYVSSIVSTSVALGIVWFVTGLWHGASWGYVAWGVYYGTFMILGVLMGPVHKALHDMAPNVFDSKVYGLFTMIRTFTIVVVGYAIFKPADLSATAWIFKSAIGLQNIGLSSCRLFVKDSYPMWAGVVAMFAVDIIHYNIGYGKIRQWIASRNSIIRLVIYVVTVLYVLNFGMFGDGFNHFEYFKF